MHGTETLERRIKVYRFEDANSDRSFAADSRRQERRAERRQRQMAKRQAIAEFATETEEE